MCADKELEKYIKNVFVFLNGNSVGLELKYVQVLEQKVCRLDLHQTKISTRIDPQE